MSFNAYWLGPIVAGLGAVRTTWWALRKWRQGDAEGMTVLQTAASGIAVALGGAAALRYMPALSVVICAISLPEVLLSERRYNRLTERALWWLFPKLRAAHFAEREWEQAIQREVDPRRLTGSPDDPPVPPSP